MRRSDVADNLVWLRTEYIEVGVATAYGPRITWFSRPGADNVFAELGALSLDAGDGRRYTLRGGHRLWVGPELPELTYQTDDDAVAVVQDGHSFTVQARADGFGLVKSMTVTAVEGEASVVVDHTVRATAVATLDVAAWAITQLRPGGVGVLPLGLPGGPLSDFQAAHEIVMWPYTDPDDPALAIGRTEVTLTTDVAAPTKIGTPLKRGWLAYAVDDVVFVKRAAPVGDRFVDLGATGQVYSSVDFIELETLGPITPIAANTSLHHQETWRLYDRPDVPADQLGAALGLDGEST